MDFFKQLTNLEPTRQNLSVVISKLHESPFVKNKNHIDLLISMYELMNSERIFTEASWSYFADCISQIISEAKIKIWVDSYSKAVIILQERVIKL